MIFLIKNGSGSLYGVLAVNLSTSDFSLIIKSKRPQHWRPSVINSNMER